MAKLIKHLLKKGFNFQVTGSLWIECEGERFLGPGKVELLERIADTGSINKAAKQMGMSYKKAWEMIKVLNTQTAKPVVIKQTGGEKGGGSIITEEAWQLIKYHRLLRERFTAFLKKETSRLGT
jgi:molybdate transport system regulatory protein